MVGVASAMAALAAGLAFPSAASAHSLAYKSFTWKTQNAGDCTMFEGARWTLYPNGTAKFDGTVRSSADNDAWLMWAYFKDENNAVLGQLTNSEYQTADRGKFVKGLANDEQTYRWFASARFDRDLYPLIKRMSLKKHC
jgi:CubicO group peptidase (beta-lactamase class C family)